MNVTLIGMPGAGKSLVGQALARRLGWAFLDVDPLIVSRHRAKTLQQVLDALGNQRFLDAEADVISQVSCDATVIAPGGSAVLRDKGMARLKALGPVVYLSLPCDELKRRLGNLATRGVSLEPGQSLDDLYAYRLPYYERWADVTVDTSRCSIDQAAERIVSALGLESPQAANLN